MARKNNKLTTLVIVLLAAIFLLAGGLFAVRYINNDINGIRHSESTSMKTIIITEQNNELYDVSVILSNFGLINSDTVWCYWMDKHYPDFEFVAGEYSLSSTMSYEQIAIALQNPDITHQSVKVCIPEGYDVFKISQTMQDNGICSAEDFLEACRDKSKYDYSFISDIPDNDKIAYQLEGFLFPATYDLSENMNAFEVVDTMLSAFADRITPEWRDYCADNDMTLFELVTLSSIVEKETLGEGVAQRIASVFINRLNAKQQLQSDVTIDYGNKLREAGFSDEVVFSYNTYKCAALPSGPICNAGVANIDAVVNHESTDYFYFFSYNNGADFYFTDNYNDFQKQWERLGSTNTN